LIKPTETIRAFVAELVTETAHDFEHRDTTTLIRHRHWPRLHLQVFYYEMKLWGCMRRAARYYHGDADLTDLDSCFFDLQDPDCAEKFKRWVELCFAVV
jgi:hypothetical protein